MHIHQLSTDDRGAGRQKIAALAVRCLGRGISGDIGLRGMPVVAVLELGNEAQVYRIIQRLCCIIRCYAKAYGEDLVRVHGADVILIRREDYSLGRRNNGDGIEGVFSGIGHI